MKRKFLQGREIGNWAEASRIFGNKRMKNGDFVISAESRREFGVFWNVLKTLSKHRENFSNIFLRKIEINKELRFSNFFTELKIVGSYKKERERMRNKKIK